MNKQSSSETSTQAPSSSNAAFLKQKNRRAYASAVMAVTCVILFACAYIGFIVALDQISSRQHTKPDIEVVADVPQEPFYVLLIGSDSRKGTAMYTGKASEHAQVDQHADVMTLVRIDPLNYQITLVSIPRDTVLDGQTEKINASLHDNDPLEVLDAARQLTGLEIDYYMMTTFIGFENLINALEGVNVDVAQTITVSDPATGKDVTVKEGKNQHLDGSKALVFARARKSYGVDNDTKRQVNVRLLEQVLIEKMLLKSQDFDIDHVLAALDGNVKTNLDLSTTASLILDFEKHADDVTIYSGTGPYDDEIRESDEASIVPENKEVWARLVEVVDAGGNPADVVEPPKI